MNKDCAVGVPEITPVEVLNNKPADNAGLIDQLAAIAGRRRGQIGGRINRQITVGGQGRILSKRATASRPPEWACPLENSLNTKRLIYHFWARATTGSKPKKRAITACKTMTSGSTSDMCWECSVRSAAADSNGNFEWQARRLARAAI